MAYTSKVKVHRDLLLERVKQRKEKLIERHKEAYEKYVSQKEDATNEVLKKLEKIMADIEENGYDKYLYYNSALRVDVKAPQPIPEECNTIEIDRLIATLEISAEETIQLSADDAAQYLG